MPVNIFALLPVMMLVVHTSAVAADMPPVNAEDIMQRVSRHQPDFPYVYEELSLIMIDNRDNHDVRNARYYKRFNANGSLSLLIVLDSPEEIKGVALRAVVTADNVLEKGVFLPAFENRLLTAAAGEPDAGILGTDFSVNDLQPENTSLYRYKRLEDAVVEDVGHYVVEALPLNQSIQDKTGYYRRIHFIRKDNFVITKTDYQDHHRNLVKSLTRHEIQSYERGILIANMLLMENHQLNHKTLLKVKRRIFSHNYVPAKIFKPQWLFNNRHMATTSQHLFRHASEPPPGTEVAAGDTAQYE